MARYSSPKSRRKLLAENRELTTQLGQKKIAVDNLTQQRDEALSSVQNVVRELDQERRDRRMHELNVEAEIARAWAIVGQLGRELYSLLRTSMRKDGMAFEDIERILSARMNHEQMRGGCACSRCRPDNGGNDMGPGFGGPSYQRKPLGGGLLL